MKVEESILSHSGFPLRLKAANMSFAFQLSFIFISSAVIIAQRDKESGIGSSAINCPASDGTIGNCLTVIQCRRKMSQLRNFQTPSMCFVRQGVRYLCCPVTGIKQPNTNPLNVPRPVNPRPISNINNAPPRVIPRPSSNLVQSARGFNLPGCGRSAITTPDTGTIIGGRQAKKHAWPWMAGIRIKTDGENTRFICGGSLITNKHILSAAHCFGENRRAPSDYKVVLGGHYRESGTDSYPDEEGVIVATPTAIRIHEKYKSTEGQDNDIAVLALDRDISFNDYVNSICLPTVANYQEEGFLTVIGWGHTSFKGSPSDTLHEVNIEVVKTRRCRYLYRRVQLPKGITDNMLCAGNVKGERDSCQLDSGGPLMQQNTAEYKWTQVGVVSFGLECGRINYPGVYVKVSNYLAWIQKIVRHT